MRKGKTVREALEGSRAAFRLRPGWTYCFHCTLWENHATAGLWMAWSFVIKHEGWAWVPAVLWRVL